MSIAAHPGMAISFGAPKGSEFGNQRAWERKNHVSVYWLGHDKITPFLRDAPGLC